MTVSQTLDIALQNSGSAGAVRAFIADNCNAIGMASGIDPLVFEIAIFILSIFVGYYVVWSVTPALHTPLMSITNAISSVIVVGALIAIAGGAAGAMVWTVGLSRGFGCIALLLASVNIAGGFVVTRRMLAMYRKKR